MADAPDELPVQAPPGSPEAAELACPECGVTRTKAGNPFTVISLAGHRATLHGFRNPDAKKRKPAGKKPATRERARREPAEPRDAKDRPPTRAELDRMTAALASATRKAGAMAFGFGVQVGGLYVWENAEGFARPAVGIASRNAKLARYFAKAEDVMDYVPLGSFLAGAAIAVSVDFGRGNPNSLLARELGVTRVVAEGERIAQDMQAWDREVAEEAGESVPTGGAVEGNGYGLPAPEILGGSPGPRPADVETGGAL